MKKAFPPGTSTSRSGSPAIDGEVSFKGSAPACFRLLQVFASTCFSSMGLRSFFLVDFSDVERVGESFSIYIAYIYVIYRNYICFYLIYVILVPLVP